MYDGGKVNIQYAQTYWSQVSIYMCTESMDANPGFRCCEQQRQYDVGEPIGSSSPGHQRPATTNKTGNDQSIPTRIRSKPGGLTPEPKSEYPCQPCWEMSTLLVGAGATIINGCSMVQA